MLTDENFSRILSISRIGVDPFFLITYLDLLVKNLELKVLMIFVVSLVALWMYVETLVELGFPSSSSIEVESLCSIIGVTVLLNV